MSLRRFAAWILLFVLTSQLDIATAQEWTRFRGPNGAGQSDAATIPATWTKADYNWVAQLPGIGHSSPVVWGDRIFVQSADPDSGLQYVLCLAADRGETIWKREFSSSTYHIHTRNSFASASPAVDAKHVYVTWATPEQLSLIALHHDGDIAWTRDDLGPFTSQHGFGSSPMLVGDLVVLCNQQQARRSGSAETSSILAFDRHTGQPRWKTPRISSKASYSVPCLYETPDGRQELITCSTAHGIFSLDPDTGKENWSTDVFSMRTVSSPVVVGNLVFGSTGSGAGGNYVVAVQLDGNHDIAYKVDRQAPYVPTVVQAGDLVFLWSDKGVVACLEAATGEPFWTKRVGGNYSGSPVRVGDRVYCISEDGDVVVIAASKKYELIGKTSLGEPSRSTPAVADGRMYLRTYSQLFSVGGE